MQDRNAPQLIIAPQRAALIQGVAQTLQVLLRVQAPDAAPDSKGARKPYHLSLVIDRSGSMQGLPLAEAVRCASHMLGRLQATDTASLVVFDDRVDVLVPPRAVGSRRHLDAALASIASGGTTNLHGGWQAGADGLLAGVAEAAMARVILLSDGNANAGATTATPEIAAMCAAAAEVGVTTSTYGLGRGFNEELMVEMARRGGGNHYYGDTAADLFEPFAEEFDLISSLYARNVRLSLVAAAGVRVRVLNDCAVEGSSSACTVNLPDIPYGAEAWALVDLEIPAALADGAAALLRAAVSATSPDGDVLAFPESVMTLPAMPAAAWEVLLPDPLVASRQAELAAGKLLADARAASERGDWEAIEAMIAEAGRRFADHAWVKEVIAGLADLARERDRSRFSKEALYSSRKMASRLMAKEELLSSLDQEAESASFLRRKRSQGKAEFGRRPPEVGKE